MIPGSTFPNLVELLRARAAETPDGLAYCFLRDGASDLASLTYGELDRAARLTALRLTKDGLAGDARLLVADPDPLNFLAAFFGVLYAGMTAVPAAPPAGEANIARLASQADDCGAAALLLAAPLSAKVQETLVDHGFATRVILTSPIRQQGGDSDGWVAPPVRPDSLAFLQYTSGSTTAPRGARVTHANVMANEALIRTGFGHGPDTVFGSWLPLFHDMGLIGGALQPLYLGVPCYLLTPRHFLERPIRWLKAISTHRITTSGAPNFAYETCVQLVKESERSELDLSSWQVAFNGAEPVRAETLRRFSEAFAPCGFSAKAFYPCYGLAEATLFVTGAQPGGGPRVEYFDHAALENGRIVLGSEGTPGSVPLVSNGLVRPGAEVAIVDPDTGGALPQGRIGEVWIAGHSVAEGYWGAGDDAGPFKHGLASHPEASFLRTGDLGFVHDGELFISGRLKDLIIVRGRNIFSADIEAVVSGLGLARRRGTCAAFALEESPAAGVTVVVEAQANSHQDRDDAAFAIRREVATKLGIMIHTVAFASGRLPRTTSGKLQRSLAARQFASGNLDLLWSDTIHDPATMLDFPQEMEADGVGDQRLVLAMLESEAVRLIGTVPDIHNRPLAEMGLDSLGATLLANRIGARLGRHLPAALLLSGATLAELAAKAAITGGDGAPPAGDQQGGPASLAQEIFALNALRAPGRTADNIAVTMRLPDGCEAQSCRRGLAGLILRHGALRTAIVEDGDGFRQEVRAGAEAVLGEYRHADEAEVAAAVQRQADEPFILSEPPLIRASLHSWPGGSLVNFVLHHAVADYWSLVQLMDEFQVFLAGAEPDDPVPPGTYLDFARDQRAMLASPEGQVARESWRTELGQSTGFLRLPGRGDPEQAGRGASVPMDLPPPLAGAVRALAAQLGVTPFIVVLGGFLYLLKVLSGEKTVTVSVPFHNRGSRRWERTVGCFVNLLPVVARFERSNATFAEFLADLRQTMGGVMARQEIPLPALDVDLPRRGTRTPLTQVGFTVYKSQIASVRDAAGLGLRGRQRPGISSWEADSDLSAIFTETGDGWLGRLEFDRGCMDPDTAAAISGKLVHLLERVTGAPSAPLLPGLAIDDAERRRLLIELGCGPCAPRPNAPVHGIIADIARRFPQLTAASQGDRVLTYAELETQSGKVAAMLGERGIGPGSVVSVVCPPGPDLAVAMLGVWKAGACALPVDPAYPEERRRLIAEDAAPRLALDADGLADALGRSPSGTFQPPTVGPEAPCYMIYTSGSTGRPKGVVVPHRALVNVIGAQAMFLVEEGDRVVQLASPGFDASVFEIVLALGAGATLVAPVRRPDDGGALADILRQGIDHAVLPPSLVQMIPAGDRPPLRTLIVAGEECPPSLVAAWAGRCRMFNAYGPTEAGIWTTVERVTPGAPVTIGGPIANTRVLVLEPDTLSLLPEGAPGELCIAGSGLALGYHGRPDLTADRFRQPDWLPYPIYRTGDLARFVSGGRLQFLGRIDRQIKLRGVRIELGEIEKALMAEPGIAHAHAMLWEPLGGEPQLAAFYSSAEGEAPPPSPLRARLAQRLPSAMVPARLVPLPFLPVNNHGKVDESRLRSELVAPKDMPRMGRPLTHGEEKVAAVWRAVLGVDTVSPDDDLFALGAHSLNLARIAAGLQLAFDRRIPLAALFENPQLSRQATAIEALAADGHAIEAADTSKPIPLTRCQQDIFVTILMGRPEAFLVPMAARLSGPLDIRSLEAAISDVVARHPMLRATITRVGDEPAFAVGEAPPDIRLEDLTGTDATVATARARIGEELDTPFDFENAPAFRARIYRLGEEEHMVLILTHHLMFDGWSGQVFFRDLSRAYRARREGSAPETRPLPKAFPVDPPPERMERNLTYWEAELGMLPPCPTFIADQAGQATGTAVGFAEYPLPIDLLAVIEETARHLGVTRFALMMAAFLAMLIRHTGQKDLVIGTVNANRTFADQQSMVGYLAEILLLRLSVGDRTDFAALARTVNRKLAQGMAHGGVSLAEIMQRLGIGGGRAGAGFPNVLFVEVPASFRGLTLDGLTVDPLPQAPQGAKFDVVVSVAFGETDVRLQFEYDAAIFARTRIARMAEHLLTLMRAAAADPASAVATTPLLTAEEKTLLGERNRTQLDRSFHGPLHLLFEEQVRKAGDRVGIRYEGEEISYAQLHGRARSVARDLRCMGVRPGEAVGVHALPGIDMVASLLGVMMAGGAYVPLDPALPLARVGKFIQDTAMRCVVVACRDGRSFAELGMMEVPVAADHGHGSDDLASPPAATPDDPAYIIFTSGSTGEPKGVVNTHRGIVNRLQWMQDAFCLSEGEKVLFKTSFTFDVSVWEIFWPLCFGGTIVVARPGGSLDPAYLDELMASEKIAVTHFVPSVLAAYLESRGSTDLPDLRLVICSGDELTEAVRDRVFASMNAELHNLYGPTEAAIDVSHYQCKRGEIGRVPIGRPISNITLHVLDDLFQPVPLGAVGELFIGGVGVASGYINKPELTRQRFIPSPLSEYPDRFYRTGDLARWNEQAELEFLGRIDSQVKIRGFRVEPEEVAAAIREVAATMETIVVPYGQSSQRSLVAYSVAGSRPLPPAADIRRQLADILPNYMIPSQFIAVESIPRLSSGKVNPASLPTPNSAVSETRSAPSGKVEAIVLDLWQEILGREAIGIDDNFFDIGGHSLLILRLQTRISQVLGVNVAVTKFFQYPTIRSFSRSILAAPTPPPPSPHGSHSPNRLDRLGGFRDRQRRSRTK